MKNCKTFTAVSAFCSLAFACKKESVTPSVLYQLKVANTSASLARVMAGTVQWTSGFASAKEIEFEAKNKDNEVEYKTEVVRKVDLFTSLSTLSTIHVPQGTYKEIKFQIEVAPNGNDASFELAGDYTSNGITTPVRFLINTPVEIETKKEDFTLSTGDNYTAITTFNLSLLTLGITTAQLDAASRTAGVLEISATSNINLYNLLFDRLRNCGGIEIKD